MGSWRRGATGISSSFDGKNGDELVKIIVPSTLPAKIHPSLANLPLHARPEPIRTHIVTCARKGIKLLANLRGCPSIVVRDDDLRRRNVCAEKGECEGKGAHSFELTEDGAPGV